MNDSLKKIILFAVGAASMTKEKVEEFVQEMEKEGALNEEEGRELVQQVLSKSEERAKKFSEQVRAEVKRVLAEMDVKSTEGNHKDCECGEDGCECGNRE